MPLHRRSIALGNITLHIGRHTDTIVCSQLSSLRAKIRQEKPYHDGWVCIWAHPYQASLGVPALRSLVLPVWGSLPSSDPQTIRKDSSCSSTESETFLYFWEALHTGRIICPPGDRAQVTLPVQCHRSEGNGMFSSVSTCRAALWPLHSGALLPEGCWVLACRQESSKWNEKFSFSFALLCWPPCPLPQ